MKNKLIKRKIILIITIILIIVPFAIFGRKTKNTNMDINMDINTNTDISIEEDFYLLHKNIQDQINKRAQEYHFHIKTKDTYTTQTEIVDCSNNQLIHKGEEVFLQATDGWGGSQMIHIGGIGTSETKTEPKADESILLCNGVSIVEFFAIKDNERFHNPGSEAELEIGSPVEFIKRVDQSTSTVQIGSIQAKGFVEKVSTEALVNLYGKGYVSTHYSFVYKDTYYSFHKYQYENIEPNDPKKANKELFNQLADQIFDSITFY